MMLKNYSTIIQSYIREGHLCLKRYKNVMKGIGIEREEYPVHVTPTARVTYKGHIKTFIYHRHTLTHISAK